MGKNSMETTTKITQQAKPEERETDLFLLEIYTAGASQPSCLHGLDDDDGDGHYVGVGGGPCVMPQQGPELDRGHGNRKLTSNVPSAPLRSTSASKLLSGGPSVGVDDSSPLLVASGCVMPQQGPELDRGHGNRKLTSNVPSAPLRSTSASKLLSGGPSGGVDDSSPLLVASGLIVKVVDGNEKAPASKVLSGRPSVAVSDSRPLLPASGEMVKGEKAPASKVLSGRPSVAVGDSRPLLPASGAMVKGEKAPVSQMTLNSNAAPSMSASKLFSGGPSSAVASRTEGGTSRYQKWPVLPLLRPSSPPSRPPSIDRLAPRPVVAAGFVADTTLANDLNRLHLGDDRRGTSGLTLTLPASAPPMNIPTNSYTSQITTPRNNSYSIDYEAYCIPSNSLYDTNRNPLLGQFQQQFPGQGIFPNPQLGNFPIPGAELARINHQTAMSLLPENSAARSSSHRANDAAARSKYPAIYEEPRRARMARNNLTLERWRRPYHTWKQWFVLFAQIDLQLQAEGAPTSVSALLLRRHGGWTADVKDAIYCIARNKHSCLVLQDKLREGSHMAEMILDGVLDHALELMADASGNYLMQKLIEVCTQEQLMEIFFAINRRQGAVVGVSLNAHGTRSVQALIKNLENRQLITWVIAALQPGLLRLFNDPNGNHVVQSCLTYLTPDENSFIFEAAKEYCVDLSTHQQGCVMIQQCINYAAGGMHERALLLEVAANSYQLAQNKYGNYVVQYVLKRNNPTVMANLAFQLRGKYVELSKDKYGSHVVEKCLLKFSENDQNVIISELLSHPFGLLMQDPFANYVIQNACKFYEGPFLALLEAAIDAHQGLASSPYCKGIFSKLKSKKREDDFSPDPAIYRVQ